MSSGDPTGRRLAVLALALLVSGACTAHLTVQPQVLSGSFQGETADGHPVVLTFSQGDEAFRGEGTIDGRPVVVAGAVGLRAVGSLVGGDGAAEPVELSLAADGGSVTLARTGAEPLTLERAAAPALAAPGGPFSGRYRAERDRAPLAEVTLVQSGSLLAGAGIVAGEPAGIAGRVTGPRAADGVVTLLDGSQTRFTAELAADGRSLVLSGFGDPLTFTRGGAR